MKPEIDIKKFINKDGFKKTALSVSTALLMAVFVGAVVVAPGGVAGTLKIIDDLFYCGKRKKLNKGQVSRSLHYLKSKKLIDIQNAYGKKEYRITRLGRKKLEQVLMSSEIESPDKWDKKWRIVIFDIPMNKRSMAGTFRRQLRELGFANIQKSIWVHPFECREQVGFLAEGLGIGKFVRCILAEEISGSKDLSRRFELSI